MADKNSVPAVHYRVENRVENRAVQYRGSYKVLRRAVYPFADRAADIAAEAAGMVEPVLPRVVCGKISPRLPRTMPSVSAAWATYTNGVHRSTTPSPLWAMTTASSLTSTATALQERLRKMR